MLLFLAGVLTGIALTLLAAVGTLRLIAGATADLPDPRDLAL